MVQCVETGEKGYIPQIASELAEALHSSEHSVRVSIHRALKSGGMAYGLHWRRVAQ